MKIAVAKYPVGAPRDFAEFSAKQRRLLEQAAGQGAQLAVLPEYLSLELGATFDEPVRGDLSDRASLAAGATGADVAFHLAAHLGEWGSWADFEQGNVEGTHNALAACEEAGVRRFQARQTRLL